MNNTLLGLWTDTPPSADIIHLCVLLGSLRALGAGLLPLDATHAAREQAAVERVVDVALAVAADPERRDVHELLAHTDVALQDQHARVVDRARKLALEDDRLEAALQEVLVLQRQHVIELVLVLREDAETVQTAQHRTTLEHTALVVLLERQEETRALAQLRQRIVHAVHLALAAETVDAAQTQLRVEALLLERTTGGRVHTRVVAKAGDLAHPRKTNKNKKTQKIQTKEYKKKKPKKKR